MSPEFKDFLQGLLNKTPHKRIGWPELLQHPFIKETEEEKQIRYRREKKYNIWAGIE